MIQDITAGADPEGIIFACKFSKFVIVTPIYFSAIGRRGVELVVMMLSDL
jgi:hypothetical protein